MALIAESIIRNAVQQGVHLFVKDGELGFKQKKGATFSASLKADIVKNKADIVNFLDVNSSKAKNKRSEIVPVKNDDAVQSISFAQQRLWLLDKIDGGSSHYNVPAALKLTGKLNFEVLNRSFKHIVERHQILRTCFNEDSEGQPFPQLIDHEKFNVDLHDLSELSDDIKQMEIERRVSQEAGKAFALNQDFMLRAQVLKLAESEFILLVTMHHIASDDWSLGILVEEFVTIYKAYIAGNNNPLPALKIQYSDYAHWQREWLVGDVLAEKLKFWSKQLADLPIVHSLPLDFARPAVQSFSGQRYSSFIGTAIQSKLNEFCRAQNATLFMGLQAAFAVLLSRYSNEKDIVMGSAVANRDQDELAPLIGFFTNNLVLRTDLTGSPSFREMLARSKNMLLDAYAHQDISFEQIVEKLQPERNISHTPLFQVMITLHNTGEGSLDLPDISLSTFSQEKSIAKYDLILNVNEGEQGLFLSWEFNSDLFAETSIAQLAKHFERLLSAMLERPEENIFTVPMLTDEEKHQQLNDWNNTSKAYDKKLCVHQLVEQQAKNTPLAIAAQFESTELNYAELNQQSNRLAHCLIEAGTEVGDCIGIYLDRSIEMLIAILAVMKSGATYVPLEPSHPLERLNLMIKDAEIDQVLLTAELLEKFPMSGVDVLLMDNAATDKDWMDDFPTDNISAAEINVSAADPAYILYTSGSTGKPKGVMVQHSGVVNYLLHAKEQYFGNDIKGAVVSSPLCFDATLTTLLTPLIAGKTVKLLANNGDSLTHLASQLFDNADSWVFKITPAHLEALSHLADENTKNLAQHKIVVGGEQLTYKTLKSYREQFLPNACFINEYGPTETVVGCSTFTIEPKDKNCESESPANAVPIGKPICNSKLAVLSQELELQPVNTVGELYIAGDGVTLGYLNRAEMTQQNFVSFAIFQGARLYKTGDLVRWRPDGNLEFVGRVDHQVKIRGFRIELAEIESLLLANEDVQDAAVLLIEEMDRKQLVAFVVPKTPLNSENTDSSQVDRLNLSFEYIARLRESLPEYMVPAACILLESMPLTANGKLDQTQLKAMSKHDVVKSENVAPRDDLEKKLAEVWSSVLKLDSIGIRDNFFSIGGDSILSIKIVSQLKKAGVEISIQDIFRFQTVEALSKKIRGSSVEAKNNLTVSAFQLLQPSEKLLVEDSFEDLYPMSALQAGMVFHTQKSGFNGIYHDINAELVRFQWDQRCFEEALRLCIESHPLLRTGFLLDGERPLQFVNRNIELPLEIEDIRSLNKADQEAKIKLWTEERRKHIFDWRNGPLFQVNIFLRDSDVFEFIISFHHSILDGWSRASLITELYQSYTQLLSAKSVEKLEVDWLYRHYVAEEIAVLENKDAKAFFVNQLEDSPMIQLPVFKRKESKKTDLTTKGMLHVESVTKLSHSIINLAKDLGVPVQAVLLAAHFKVLTSFSGQNKATSCVVTNGRPEIDGGERGLGLFLNSLPMCLQVNNEKWSQLILRIAEHMTQSMAYRQYPLSQIQQDVDADFSEVLFNYIHFHVFNEISQNNETSTASDNNAELEVLRSTGDEFTNFDFSVDFSRSSLTDELTMSISYNSTVFEIEIIEKIGVCFEKILSQIVENTESNTGDISLISSHEIDLLWEMNNTVSAYPKDSKVHELFSTQARETPDNIALAYLDRQITYRELDEKSNQLANYIRTLGVSAGSLVGVCTKRSIDMITAILATLKAGAAFVPLDPGYPDARLKYMVEDSGITCLLTHSSLVEKLDVAETLEVVELDVVEKDIAMQAVNLEKCSAAESALTEVNHSSSLAYLIYTSGTTGNPKGVMIEHSSLVNNLVSQIEYFAYKADSVFMFYRSFCFDGVIEEYLLPLIFGGKMVILPQNDYFDVDNFMQTICSQKVTKVAMSPTLLLSIKEQLIEVFDKSSLRTLVIGGEKFSNSLAMELVDAGYEVVNSYGPSECTIDATRYRYHDELTTGTSIIGKAVANCQLYVLDNNLNFAPIGACGELYIGGDCLARGYLNQEELSKERFVSNPFFAKNINTSPQIYRTGDLVRYHPDGNLEYLERIDAQVKIRGFRVETSEIEFQLEKSEEVKSAKILVRKDEHGDEQLIAYVQLLDVQKAVSNNANRIETIRNTLAQVLPGYMIPDAFIEVQKWPLTQNGKIDQNQLLKMKLVLHESKYTPPESDLENALCEIWREVLAVETVGTTDGFFDLGGNSIKALQLISATDKAGYQMALGDLWRHQTIRALTQYITIKANKSESISTPVDVINQQSSTDESEISQQCWVERFSINSELNETYLRHATFKLFSNTKLGFRIFSENGKRGLVKVERTRKDVSHLWKLHRDVELNVEPFISQQVKLLTDSILSLEHEPVGMAFLHTPNEQVCVLAVHESLINKHEWRSLVEEFRADLEHHFNLAEA